MKSEASGFAGGTVFEGMTSISAVISAWEAGVSDRKITKVLFDIDKAKSKSRQLSYLKLKSGQLGFPIEFTSAEEIEKAVIGTSHGGIIAYCTERKLETLTDGKIVKNGFYVMLEGIEDPYNFGYAVRSIYASGADGLILSPRNWMGAAGVVCRSSAGASELMPIYVGTGADAAALMRNAGYKVVGAGIRDSVSAFDADLSCPLFLIVGGEKRGISASLLSVCDEIVRLDYGRDFRGSLSAASAASILSYEVLRQNRNRSK